MASTKKQYATTSTLSTAATDSETFKMYWEDNAKDNDYSKSGQVINLKNRRINHVEIWIDTDVSGGTAPVMTAALESSPDKFAKSGLEETVLSVAQSGAGQKADGVGVSDSVFFGHDWRLVVTVSNTSGTSTGDATVWVILHED